MPTSKAQQRATDKWQKEHYDFIKLKMTKGKKEEIKVHADSRGESMNAFILRSVSETMSRDNETPEE